MIWDSYPVDRDGNPHHVAWRVDLFEGAPDRTRPVRIDIALTINAPDSDGLPGSEELEVLNALRDALEYDVVEATDARYALRVTGGGRQVHTFYAPRAKGFFRKKPTPKVAAEVARALLEEFPHHALSVESADDEDWQTFLDAFPSTDAVQWFADARAVSALIASGDDLVGPRALTHWLLLPEEEARESVAALANGQGYAVIERFPLPDAPEHGFGLTVQREEPNLELATLHRAVMALVEAVEAHGGVHHRWEPAPSPNAPPRPDADADEGDDEDDA